MVQRKTKKKQVPKALRDYYEGMAGGKILRKKLKKAKTIG